VFDWTPHSFDPQDECLGARVSTKPTDSLTADTILLGLPFDGAVLGRKGCARGPHALRAAAKNLKSGRIAQPSSDATAYDLGDAYLPEDVALAHAGTEGFVRLARRFTARGKREARIIALGGDHSLSFPIAKPFLDEHGDAFAVINLDAHLDVRHVLEGQPPNSGTSFGRLLDAGLKTYVCIGTRDFHTSPAYIERARKAKATLISAGEVHAAGARKIAARVLAKLPKTCRAIYLSIDLDVADASVAPGVSAPTPGGLFAHQVFELIRAFASDRRTRVASLHEFAPNLEPHGDLTARFGAGCLAELIGGSQA
jgi:formimidoylglutamase